MKTFKMYALLVLFFGLCLSSCGEDDSETMMGPDENGELATSNGVTADDFETFQGNIGMVYNARNVAQKGYTPATAQLTIEGSEGDYSQTIDLDPFSFMGKVEIAVEDLSEAAKTELQDGVPVGINLFDGTGTNIYNGSISAVSFSSNPAPSTLNINNLPETIASSTLLFQPQDSYVMQRVDEDGNPITQALRRRTNDNPFMRTGNADFSDISVSYEWRIIPVSPNNPNIFVIQNAGNNGFVFPGQITTGIIEIYLAPQITTNGMTVNQAINDEAFHFKIQKESDGVYTIRNVNGQPLRRISDDRLIFENLINGETGSIVYWRAISTEVQWQVENIGTSFVAPILPKAQTSFGANSTLTNCTSGGGLSQTVGTNLTESVTNSVGWSESLSIVTTNSVDVSVTMGVEFGASFFGAGADVSASVTGAYGWSRSVTESSSNFGESASTTQENVFFERTVTVPPNSASLVYDVVQFYPDTKVQMTQRLRIRGTDDGVQLSGEVIKTLFRFSRFNGVITEIGSDFIEVSIRGTMTLDKVLETQSEVQEVDPNCNG
jgi:hypothetical protein